MKYCEKCKKEYSNRFKYCQECGGELVEIVEAEKTATPNEPPKTEQKTAPNKAEQQPQKKVVVIKHRSIPLAIFLSIITCGIYGIYWMVKITNDTNALTKDTEFVSGIVAFLLTLVTCGIFMIYWAYKIGKKVDQLDNTGSDHTSILFLVLSIICLDIVVFALTQDTINRKIMKENA